MLDSANVLGEGAINDQQILDSSNIPIKRKHTDKVFIS